MFLVIDAKYFYLETTMTQDKYIYIFLQMLFPPILVQYNLTSLIQNNCVYVEIRKGMFGLPQAGKMAKNQSISPLAPFGYDPVPFTACLLQHNIQDITFCLVVDNFGPEHTNNIHTEHLLSSVHTYNYKLNTGWTGSCLCGPSLCWDYCVLTCAKSMPGYITRTLTILYDGNCF
jgi:hypothetical protein